MAKGKRFPKVCPRSFEGLLMGSLANNDSISATIGGIVGGLIPSVGLATEIMRTAARLDIGR